MLCTAADVSALTRCRCSLEEVRKALQERMQRWQLIERFCGFEIISNPGIDVLESQLKPVFKKGM